MKKILALIFFVPLYASAHAFPVSYIPEGFSIQTQMPSVVSIRFSQDIATSSHQMDVYREDGIKMPPAPSVVDPNDAHVLTRTLTQMGGGIYVVSWSCVSRDDGHFTKGAFSFFVGATTSAPLIYGGSGTPQSPSPLFVPAPGRIVDVLSVFALLVALWSLGYFVCVYARDLRQSRLVQLRAKRTRQFVLSMALFCVCGALSVWVHLKSITQLTASVWGSALITVMLLVGMLYLLRIVSVFLLERRNIFWRYELPHAIAECVVAVGVIASVLHLCFLPAPIYREPLWSIMRMDAARAIELWDSGEDTRSLLLRGINEHGVPIADVPPTVIFNNTKEGIGPLVVPVIDRGMGVYDIPAVLFIPNGEWRIAVTFKEANAYDVNATIGIDYPREVDAARLSASTPRWDKFATLLTLFGFMIVILSLALLQYTKRAGDVMPTVEDANDSIVQRWKIAGLSLAYIIVLGSLFCAIRTLFPVYQSQSIVSDGHTVAPMQTMSHDMKEMPGM